jgi:hypothetical protein
VAGDGAAGAGARRAGCAVAGEHGGGRPRRGRRAGRASSAELAGRRDQRVGRPRRRSWACGWPERRRRRRGGGRFPNDGGGLGANTEQQTKRAERKASGVYFLARRQDLWRRARCHAGCHVTKLGSLIGCGAEPC